jgi:hypothetical protein
VSPARRLEENLVQGELDAAGLKYKVQIEAA